MIEFNPGFYRHKKGGLYFAVYMAIHTETGEKFVIYWPANDPLDQQARPASMFLDGRFTPMEEKEL